jgi:hypothetical protein
MEQKEAQERRERNLRTPLGTIIAPGYYKSLGLRQKTIVTYAMEKSFNYQVCLLHSPSVSLAAHPGSLLASRLSECSAKGRHFLSSSNRKKGDEQIRVRE